MACKSRTLHMLGASLVALVVTIPAHAQTGGAQTSAPQTSGAEAEESAIVVTGVRGQPRTVQDSPVPIDHFSSEDIEKVSHTDTLNVLQTVVPSFNVTRQPNSNTGTFVRPISLRGLPEDKTLLLMNGKRRHKAASIGSSGTGAQGSDAAVIPSLALKSLEVLRDGAAAQYGSDAIAGVINFQLKDANEGMTLVAQTGQYYKNDGDSILLMGNVGLPLTDHGFVNITAEYSKDEGTTRANQFSSTAFDATSYAAANPGYASLIDLDKPLQRWGQPISHAFRAVVNSGIDVGDNGQIYAFGNFSKSKATVDANYRFPANGQAVNGVPVRLADGSIFSFTELFPAGFTPTFSGDVTDWSAVAGYKNTIDLAGDSSFSYDLSGRYGWNKQVYTINNTVNASIGPDSPRDFTPSQYIEQELSLNGDFAYTVPVAAFDKPLVISAGVEYRKESFTIRPGDLESYRAGPYSSADPYNFCNDNRTPTTAGLAVSGLNCGNYLSGTGDGFAGIDPVYNVLPVGSNGINGIPPSAAGKWSDRAVSVYGEVSTDPLPGWFVDFAGRYENFRSFGSQWNGKFATRYEFIKGYAVRGSIGTGFHAPSPGLRNLTSVSIRTVEGVYTQAGLFPADNPISRFLGATDLKPEKSTNYSLGFTANPLPGLDFTVDGYLIKIRDAIYATTPRNVDAALKAALIANNVPGADSIASVAYFQNAFDSTTKGFDVIASYTHRWQNRMKSNLTAAFNANWYEIDSINIAQAALANYTIYNFENDVPRWRGSVTANHEVGAFKAMVRANIFGPYTVMSTATPFGTQKFNPEAQIDMELSYTLDDKYTLSVGARNIFDNYPDPDRLQATAGRIYRAQSVVDWQGGYYYARLSFKL